MFSADLVPCQVLCDRHVSEGDLCKLLVVAEVACEQVMLIHASSQTQSSIGVVVNGIKLLLRASLQLSRCNVKLNKT
jgi:hypothetical protein